MPPCEIKMCLYVQRLIEAGAAEKNRSVPCYEVKRLVLEYDGFLVIYIFSSLQYKLITL